MNRTDVKYTFNISRLPEILESVSPYYSCLNISGVILNQYETLYYDTTRLDLYNKHHNGQLNRYKIRHRSYVSSNTGFLEIKFKNNKGRTIKNRIKSPLAETVFGEKSLAFLSHELNFDPQDLKPVVRVNYNRITLVNKNSPERVTIDLNLQFSTTEKAFAFNDLVIVEIKQDKRTISPFAQELKQRRIREGSISKYCMAIALTHKNVKLNNFREKLFALKHITHHDAITDCCRRS